jgi:hypothetical protein
MRTDLNVPCVDKSAPSEEEMIEFTKFNKHFPKPYTKAEARMLAHDNDNVDETSEEEDDTETEETP